MIRKLRDFFGRITRAQVRYLALPALVFVLGIIGAMLVPVVRPIFSLGSGSSGVANIGVVVKGERLALVTPESLGTHGKVSFEFNSDAVLPSVPGGLRVTAKYVAAAGVPAPQGVPGPHDAAEWQRLVQRACDDDPWFKSCFAGLSTLLHERAVAAGASWWLLAGWSVVCVAWMAFRVAKILLPAALSPIRVGAHDEARPVSILGRRTPIVRIAQLQRSMLVLVLASILLPVFSMVLTVGIGITNPLWSGFVELLWFLVLPGIVIAAGVCAARIAYATGSSRVSSAIAGVFCSLPWIGVLSVLVVNQRATLMLRMAGCQPGLLGAPRGGLQHLV